MINYFNFAQVLQAINVLNMGNNFYDVAVSRNFSIEVFHNKIEKFKTLEILDLKITKNISSLFKY